MIDMFYRLFGNFNLYLSVLLAFLVTVLSSMLLRPLAIRLGFIAAPGGRKHHLGRIPLIGGVAMFCGFAIGLLSLDISLQSYRIFIICCLLLVFFGVLDDFQEVKARIKLIVQFAVALLMISSSHHMVIRFLGNILFFPLYLPDFVAIPFTLIAVIGVINAVNMTDGIDGLAGSLSLIGFLALSWLAFITHQSQDMEILLLFIAVVIGFLLFNFRFLPKRLAVIFMGDSGSMLIGFGLVFFSIILSQQHQSIPAVVFLWLIAVPLFELFSVTLIRLTCGRSPFLPGSDHLHFILLKKGFSSFKITCFLSLLSLFMAFLGIMGGVYWQCSDGLMFIGFMIVFLAYFSLCFIAGRKVGFKS